MTYYNGNPYAGPTPDAPLDKVAHDECLPADQFTTTMLADLSQRITNPDGTVGWIMVPHIQQNWPWHWSPIWGRPRPCYVCGLDVE